MLKYVPCSAMRRLFKKLAFFVFMSFLLLTSFVPSVSAAPDCNQFVINILNPDGVSSDIDASLESLPAEDSGSYRFVLRVGSDVVDTSNFFTREDLPTTWGSRLDQSDANNSDVKLTIETRDGTISCSKRLTFNAQTNTWEMSSTGSTPTFDLCKQSGSPASQSRADCQACFDNEGVWTAVGCIPYKQTTQTVRALMVIGLGISGGVVVLMTLYGSFLLSTSQGDPKRVDEAKGAVSSAIFGLLFIIFSVAMLRFIGVNIFRIPGFG